MTNIFMKKEFTFCTGFKSKNRISFPYSKNVIKLKNKYGPFSETHFFQKFPQPQQQKMMTSANICTNFEFFFIK